jgi:uncharacterized membrane protein YcaP (DUF421 family)
MMELMDDIFGFSQYELDWYHMAARAVLIFFIALIFLRIAGMRAFGSKTPFDIVMTLTIGALLSRGISGHYPFFSCLAGALSLALCHRLVAYVSFRSKRIRNIIEGKPVLLYQNGKKIEANLKRITIHDDDIERVLRQQGIKNLAEVESMWYEISGSITVIKKEK